MQNQFIPYLDDEIQLEAFVSRPEGTKLPLVILCHAWKGRDEFICDKAQKIAELGFVGFALDLYGKGVLGKTNEECAKLKKPFLEDRHYLQKRLLKGYQKALTLPNIDASKIAALGFGFGGLSALDLSRAGVNLNAAISIYGHYDAPKNCPTYPVKAKILIEHGYKDPVSTLPELRAFEEELDHLGVDWTTHLYGNTYHAFATPSANAPANGLLYNPIAANRSWEATKRFLQEVL